MASLSDAYSDMRHQQFLDRWTPPDEELPEATPENLRYNIARARAAESQLRLIRQHWAGFKNAMKGDL